MRLWYTFSMIIMIILSTNMAYIQPLSVHNSSNSNALIDPCIDKNDIVFEYSASIMFSFSGEGYQEMYDQYNEWENISFPDCEQSIINPGNSSFTGPGFTIDISLDYMGYLSLQDVFQLLNLNLSENKFLDTELDPSCVDNIDLQGWIQRCKIISLYVTGNQYLSQQIRYSEIDDFVLTPQMQSVTVALVNESIVPSSKLVSNLEYLDCDDKNDKSILTRRAVSSSFVPITCDGFNFKIYNFSERNFSKIVNNSLSDYEIFSHKILNIDSYSTQLITATVDSNAGCHDIRLSRTSVESILTGDIVTEDNFATLLDVCVSGSRESLRIKLSSDERMAYVFSESGSSGPYARAVSWNIETNQTYQLAISEYEYPTTFTWIHGTHDLVGLDQTDEPSLKILNSTNSAPIRHILDQNELVTLRPIGDTRSFDLVKFRVASHEELGDSTIIISYNNMDGKSTLNAFDLNGNLTMSWAETSSVDSRYPFLDPYTLEQTAGGNSRWLPVSDSQGGTYQISGQHWIGEPHLSNSLSIHWKVKQFSSTGCNLFDFDDDGDQLANIVDNDDDNDGILDWNEWPSYDSDRDGIPNNCDFDDDNDGIMDHLDSDNWGSDYDNDGVAPDFPGWFLTGSDDNCPFGVQNWTSHTIYSMIPFDNDKDGCHDILEDFDDDNDGANDTFDDCPLDKLGGTIDVDRDGMCELEDLDDDNDGYPDVDELLCNSSEIDNTSVPSDLDNDYLCDEVDDDVDGDGFVNSNDSFPNNNLEWSDIDSDGYGDNEDDCIGDYGLSYLDRLGCSDEDSDGYSNLNDAYPYDSDRYKKSSNEEAATINWLISAIGVLTVICLLIGLKLKSANAQDKEEHLIQHEQDFTKETTQIVNDTSKTPDINVEGFLDENGYEWYEFPKTSGIWYYRNLETREWIKR